MAKRKGSPNFRTTDDDKPSYDGSNKKVRGGVKTRADEVVEAAHDTRRTDSADTRITWTEVLDALDRLTRDQAQPQTETMSTFVRVVDGKTQILAFQAVYTPGNRGAEQQSVMSDVGDGFTITDGFGRYGMPGELESQGWLKVILPNRNADNLPQFRSITPTANGRTKFGPIVTEVTSRSFPGEHAATLYACPDADDLYALTTSAPYVLHSVARDNTAEGDQKVALRFYTTNEDGVLLRIDSAPSLESPALLREISAGRWNEVDVSLPATAVYSDAIILPPGLELSHTPEASMSML